MNEMTDKTMTLDPCPFCGYTGPFDQWPCEWLDGSGDNAIRCPMCHGAAKAPTWNRRHLSQPAERGEAVALPMATAPRDGRMLRLLVKFTEHATEDAEEAWTIGSHVADDRDDDLWAFAGWCWTHDHFTEGKGEPIGWLPFHAANPPTDASLALGSWMSAALDDPSVCEEMKRDINCWFDAAMPSAPPPAAGVPDVKEMVNRFLSWRLPSDFRPDGGISFTHVTDPAWTHDNWPTGTNLFHAGQAEQMIRHLLSAAVPSPEAKPHG